MFYEPRRSNEKTPLINTDIKSEQEKLDIPVPSYNAAEARAKARSILSDDDEVVVEIGSESDVSQTVPKRGDRETRLSKSVYHCHSKHEQSKGNKKAKRTLILASLLCLAFMVAEIVGGLLAGSLAIITDAAHLLTDFASFLISIFSLYVASLPPTKRMSFGWHRAEVLGALASVLMIWVITGVLVYLAIQRIIEEDYEIAGGIMLITAAVGVAVNIFMGLLLHFGGGGHGHSHGGKSHGHSHGGGHESQKDQKNINVRAAFIHVLGDFCQSLGVLFAAYLIYYRPDFKIADPICTFVFSILVLITTLAILRDALNVLMEGKPHGIDFSAVVQSLESIEGVRKVHDLRIWALTIDKVAVACHLAVDILADPQYILKTASLNLRDQYSVYESTIQIETYQDSMVDCEKCEPPSK